MDDEGKFDRLLDAFQRQQEQINTLLSVITLQQAGNGSNLSSISPFENYDSKKEKFTNYLERFSNYAVMKNVTDRVKLAQLLCVSVGSEHYNKLAAFLGPDEHINVLTYDQLVDNFKKMLVPLRNIVVAHHYFLNIYQKSDQSVSEFVSTLQRDLSECAFSVDCVCQRKVSVADIFLRAQFIRGIRDNWLREQLLQSGETVFKELLTKAISLEASKIESIQLTRHGESSLSDTHSETFKLYDTPQLRTSARGYGDSRSRSSVPSMSQPQNSRARSEPRYKQPRPDYRSLGIEGLCLRCGKRDHRVRDCPVDRSSATCTLCFKEGHIAKVCITTLMKKQISCSSSNKSNVNYVQNDLFDDEVDYGVNRLDIVPTLECDVVDLFEVVPDQDKYCVIVFLNGKPQQFEVDSGAKFSLLPVDYFEQLRLNVPIQASNVTFRSYSGNLIESRGKAKVSVQYKNREISEFIYIVPKGYAPLLGRSWIRGLGIELQEIDTYRGSSIHSVHSNLSTDDVFARFPSIFEEKVGCAPHFVVKLLLRPGANPVFTRERVVPYALRERVNKELDSLEAAGIITPVSTSDWGSPLVVIPKPDGSVRLCVDYKCGVNERLVQANHPIRRIDEVLNSLRNSRVFCKLDLFKAYLHLKVDTESSIIQTITTHRGTYRFNRLSFGVKTAPSEFNRFLSSILTGLSKTEQYFDDLIVHGATHEECYNNLIACLQKLSEHDLHLNRKKCSFFENKIEYLGHIVEFNKISKSPDKIRAINEMSRPSNPDDVRRFLGLVTYYSSFIPDLSSLTFPLRQLLQNGRRWFWSSNCESAFIKLKSELCSDRVLMPYNPKLPVVLTTDASPTGVAAVLSHDVDGTDRPIAFASRSLSSAEMNYSQLDREALAIVFGATRFYNYVFGTKFVLVTDNEPLTRIFHPAKNLPAMTSARLLRYASFLSGFEYTVRFKKGEDNQNVDCLSRAPLDNYKPSYDSQMGNEVNLNYLHSICQISSNKVTYDRIKQETFNDAELKRIILELKNQSVSSEFTLLDDIIFRGDRIYIPKVLRQEILAELHETHLGITKTKQLARRYVYWPGLDQQIEKLVKSCENCALNQGNPKKAQVHPWDDPGNNWERVHVDYAGPLDGYHFLICMDAKSKWAEVKVLKQAPSSSSTIALLNSIFSVHGFPNVIVSDNASIFHSEEFLDYCTTNGIFQKFTAPGHPATNGLAERNVQTLKRRLKAASDEPFTIQEKIQRVLFRYRATPLACGKSPAELYLGRKLRIRLDAIFPNLPQRSKNIENTSRSFSEGERVLVRVFINNKDTWYFGQVQKKLGSRHYTVQLDSGRTLKRHIDQLKSTMVPRPQKKVSFGRTESYDVPRGAKSENNHTIPAAESPTPEPPANTPSTTVQPPLTRDNLSPTRRPVRERIAPAWHKDYVVG